MSDTAVEDAVSTLRFHHQNQLDLCGELEDVADGLPSTVSNQRFLALARRIFPTVRQAHQFEERVLFPLLNQLQGDNEQLAKSLERLQFEHWEDESFAEELSDTLYQFGTGGAECDCEKLSYMLRGFFEGLKRHMAFEAEHLLPILRRSSASLRTRASEACKTVDGY